MDLELKLLLITGEAEKVRLWMHEEQERVLNAYHWNKVQMHAAIGNYLVADQELAGLLAMKAMHLEDLTFRGAAGFILGHGVLAPTAGGLLQKMPLKPFASVGALPLNTYRLFPDEEEVVFGLWMTVKDLDREARVTLVRGLLALESGRIAQAQVWFQQTLTFLDSPSARPYRFQVESRAARMTAAHWQNEITRSTRSTRPATRAASREAVSSRDGS